MRHASADMVQAMAEHAGLAEATLGRLLLRSPRLAQYSGRIAARGAALLRDRLGVSTAQLAAMMAKHPLVLIASPARLDALLGFLTAELGAHARAALQGLSTFSWPRSRAFYALLGLLLELGAPPPCTSFCAGFAGYCQAALAALGTQGLPDGTAKREPTA